MYYTLTVLSAGQPLAAPERTNGRQLEAAPAAREQARHELHLIDSA